MVLPLQSHGFNTQNFNELGHNAPVQMIFGGNLGQLTPRVLLVGGWND